ncbi:MAG TPA: GGIII-like transmembrane region-containing protein [Edaphobacter sp.]|nr:GGIII-like transmembrane region-containing protein [Edaphobacter sp.]
MLTIIGLGAAVVLILIAIFAYSSRNKKSSQPPQQITATDRAMNPDRKRATGAGED